MQTSALALDPNPTLTTMDVEEPQKKYEYHVSANDKSHAARLIQMVGRAKRVLEIGCASGSQTRAMVEDMGCSVVGVEIDPVAAERARPYCSKLVVGNLETIDLAGTVGEDKFDVVMFADVLEHLRDPAAALQKCGDLLK